LVFFFFFFFFFFLNNFKPMLTVMVVSV
jgi:hypothetical protein